MLSLAEALAALPDTADGIAAHLTAQGIGGVRVDSCNCPITNYLTRLGFDRVDVNLTRIRARSTSGVVARVRTPWHIAEFAQRFDDGEWPELALDDAADDADPTNTQEQNP